MSSHHGILVHGVFSTKYRKSLLHNDWRDDLCGYIGGTIKDHKAVLLKSGGIEDHVHLFIRFHPTFAIASAIQLLKANSSKWVNDNRKTKQKFLWQSGYGAFSVSQSKADAVKQYIANQREHHRKMTFHDEYLAMLQKHGIDFDPKYVFEQEIVA
ncbi:Transposase IS200 like protein [Novipirellula aureliae]|uniref:Transposase IS200 like protein n=1 Tax=Novipirellula aureliae TaxID=2527966 RepID=A0A5C6E2D0_9BACT|nr:IS200/IS605 family transposase [Novipirellula aureliae]TWU43082.1 Transposase IS200 like protein [Novipirellula aureliae]